MCFFFVLSWLALDEQLCHLLGTMLDELCVFFVKLS